MSPLTDIYFEPDGHIYRVGGRRVPSVTEVLRQVDDLEGIPREYLERAAHFGRNVHLACHLYDQGVLDEESLDPALRPYLAGWRAFLEAAGCKVLESELPVYDPQLRVAGTLDKIVSWKVSAEPVEIDIKSSSMVPRSVGPQTAMYRKAYLAERPGAKLSKKRYAVHLLGDGKYRLHKLPHYDTDLNIFISCLNVQRWMEEK